MVQKIEFEVVMRHTSGNCPGIVNSNVKNSRFRGLCRNESGDRSRLGGCVVRVLSTWALELIN